MEVDQGAQSSEKKDVVAQRQNSYVELKFDADRLKIFYERIFPYKMFFKWLSYNILKTRDENTLASIDDKDISSDYFYNREFSFTLANDVYCRYLCFKTAEELKQNLVSRVPHKIDIGAVFNFAPSRHLTCSDKKAFVPVAKEMVFDIDMDAYDDVRTCCSGANVC
jgi:DNA primase small subunit